VSSPFPELGPAVQVHGPLDPPQTPELHVCPLGQAAHAAPPFPHMPLPWLAKGSHVVPLQQPEAQEVASQAQ
jgi:hypothetical protein